MIGSDGSEPLVYARDEPLVQGRGFLETTADESAPLTWLHSGTSVENRKIDVSIAMRDRVDLEWALAVARSVENAEPTNWVRPD